MRYLIEFHTVHTYCSHLAYNAERVDLNGTKNTKHTFHSLIMICEATYMNNMHIYVLNIRTYQRFQR